MIRKLATSLVLLSSVLLFADDGMWLPHQIVDLDLDEQGLQLDPADLFKSDGSGLMNAIVKLGGATGSFVSSNGLILTNHHVAYRAIQRASDAAHDYLKNGIAAEKHADEIQAFGQSASVLLDYEDVTDQIKAVLKDTMSFRQRHDAIDKAKKRMIQKAEKAGPDIRAEVKGMYSGFRYYLFRYKRLLDIRIVFAPPEDLGRFGGDIDNWMWPRHTCDFTFLRAYVSKDGAGAAYSPDNVPYRPKSFLKISLDGIKDGDFTFVMGYPGRTYRNYTLKEFEQSIGYMRERLALYADLMHFFKSESATSRDVEIKYAGKLRGLANTHKNYQGKLDGFERAHVLDEKREQQEKFLRWAAQNAKAKDEDVIKKYDEFLDRYQDFQKKKRQLESLVDGYRGAAPALLYQAHMIYRTVKEREKPDIEREADYQERNLVDIRRRIELGDRSYDFQTDKAFFKYLLARMFESKTKSIPAALKSVVASRSKDSVNTFVNDLYDRTMLQKAENRLPLVDLNLKELKKNKDPLIELAAGIEGELEELREQDKALSREKLELKGRVLDGLLQFREGRMAADANSTLRLTFGDVAGYSPKDAVLYKPYTTLTGVIEKNTGEFPFALPEIVVSLYENNNFGRYSDPDADDVVTCFLSKTNVTGGNSGSPILNAKGEQIGIIFDMTYESVIGDYYIIPELQRTISVDIRYVLFIVEKFAGATWLIEELEF